MISFTIALAVLIIGYFTYGKFVSRVFVQDPARQTPVHRLADGVDYVALPTWKIFLIQFLNIAGLGPIFGAIMGVMFGPAAFLWIVFGTIFAGAVHDYLSGMLSLRRDGASLPELVGHELGGGIKRRKLYVITLIPAMFMTAVTVTYIFFAPEGFSALTKSLCGVEIGYGISLAIGLTATLVCTLLFTRFLKSESCSPLLAAEE